MTVTVTDKVTALVPASLQASTLSILDHLMEQAGTEHAVYKCGVPQLDSWVEGGWQPESLTLLAARPNHGKTAALQTITQGILEHNPNVVLLHFALDDAKTVFISRWSANLGRVPIAAIRQKSRRTSQAIEDGVEIGVTRFRELTNRMLVFGASDIQARLDKMQEVVETVFNQVSDASGFAPQIVMTVDSPRNLDWSHISGLASNPTAATEYAGRRLKEMLDLTINGVRVGPIIFTTEHLKKLQPREGFFRPTPDDIKDSIGPQYDANLILMLWNDLAYASTMGNRESQLYFERPDKMDPRVDVDIPRDPVVDITLAKNKMGAMQYGGRNAFAFFRFYQEQSRMEPVVDPNEFMEFAGMVGN